MADFEKAIQVVLKHEGGFIDDPEDPGGATNFGLSLTYLEREDYITELMSDLDFNKNNYIDPVDIKNMPIEIAKHIYKICWWEKYQYGELENQSVATSVFDICVNIGPYRAHKFLQHCINKFIAPNVIAEDGLIGPQTLRWVNHVDPVKLVINFKCEIADFYKCLCRKNPKRAKYLKGWLNRLYK